MGTWERVVGEVPLGREDPQEKTPKRESRQWDGEKEILTSAVRLKLKGVDSVGEGAACTGGSAGTNT